MARKRRKPRPRRPPQQAATQPPQEAVAKPRRARPRPDDAPPAPWGSFPLVELAVLVALVLLVAGVITGGDRGLTMIFAGLVVGSLAGLELSLREHFAGYRSHTLLLSGAAGLAVLVLLSVGVSGLWLPAAFGIAVAVGGLAAFVLVRAFRRRSGVSFKLR
jgi:hypothetical protein